MGAKQLTHDLHKIKKRRWVMTDKQKQQFNSMHEALRRITKYDSVERLRNESENDYGLEFEEAIEMAYENMQNEAVAAIHGIRKIK